MKLNSECMLCFSGAKPPAPPGTTAVPLGSTTLPPGTTTIPQGSTVSPSGTPLSPAGGGGGGGETEVIATTSVHGPKLTHTAVVSLI